MLTRRLESRVLGEKFSFFCFDLENLKISFSLRLFFLVNCCQSHGSIFLRHLSHMQRLSQKSEIDGRSILLVGTKSYIVNPALTTQAICLWHFQLAQFTNPQTRVLVSVTPVGLLTQKQERIPFLLNSSKW